MVGGQTWGNDLGVEKRMSQNMIFSKMFTVD